MKRKALFLKAISTMFGSWGGDPPSEVIWMGNDYLVWFEAEYNVTLNQRFEEDDMTKPQDSNFNYNYEAVIEAIKRS